MRYKIGQYAKMLGLLNDGARHILASEAINVVSDWLHFRHLHVCLSGTELRTETSQ